MAQVGTQSDIKVMSLFSGCGGLDLGLTGGFEFLGRLYPRLPLQVIWANDLNKAAVNTYNRNLDPVSSCGDVWSALDSLPRRVDLVVGGFPCQDISVNGKRLGVSGPRSGLYRAMVEAVKRTRPKMFVAENVKGLLMKYNRESLATVLRDFDSLGYDVTYDLYRAADYGVPQTRERVMIVGVLKGSGICFSPPRPTHDQEKWVTAGEAIGDLAKVPEDVTSNHIWSRAGRSPEQGNRSLKASRPGYTVRAECHGNIHFHYSEQRRISMREAARIQSFPDRFLFSGGIREIERQIGNAVPPLLGWHLGNAVAEAFGRQPTTSRKAVRRASRMAASGLQTDQLSLTI